MPVTTEVDVRYRDLDTLGHVNNAVIATYVEVARTAYADEVLGIDLEEYSFVIASLSIDFERRVTLEDAVEVTAAVPDLGRSSVPMTYEVTADGELAASAETTLVFLAPETGESTPIPEAVRERVRAEEDL